MACKLVVYGVDEIRRTAWRLRVTTETADNAVTSEPIDVMTFDEQARISSMRACWAPEDVRFR